MESARSASWVLRPGSPSEIPRPAARTDERDVAERPSAAALSNRLGPGVVFCDNRPHVLRPDDQSSPLALLVQRQRLRGRRQRVRSVDQAGLGAHRDGLPVGQGRLLRGNQGRYCSERLSLAWV